MLKQTAYLKPLHRVYKHTHIHIVLLCKSILTHIFSLLFIVMSMAEHARCHSVVCLTKSRRMRWAGHVTRMSEERGVYRVLVGKPEGRRPLGRPRRR